MARELTRARIDELKATTAHCVWSDIFGVNEGQKPPDDLLATIDAYLRPFVARNKKGECVNCETPQTGMMGAMFGGFTWGIGHGEGHCETCGWPGRAYHAIPDPAGGKPLAKFSLVLQYHPDEMKLKQQSSAA